MSTVIAFTPGQTEVTVTVATTEDQINELTETFLVTLSNATAGLSIGDIATAPVTITDNDGECLTL